MAENRQFNQRLDAWQEALKEQIMVPAGSVIFSRCEEGSPADPGCADGKRLTPAPAGTAWGRYREYAWFTATFALPEGCAGKRIALISGLGGEQLVYLNGRAMGSIDSRHPWVTLFRNAPAGAACRVDVESYAGNGPRLESLGPCPPERTPIPPVTGFQQRIRESVIAWVNEDAYQLYMDADTLIRLWRRLPESSLRRMRIEAALKDYLHIADFECSMEERNASFRRARKALAPALACRNGDSAPTLELMGQSHIDLAWMWPMEETRHKVARTYANQLALMEEYPEYRFLACEPALLEMLEEGHPELFRRFLDQVRAGGMQPEGAFYAECDTNIPDGESLVRQLLWGKRWFREKLGYDSRVGWQPDTFGFSPCLPQLMKQFGVPFFATQKLLRADPECERFPWQDFLWEGTDGSRVQALSFFKNNAQTSPEHLLDRWEKHRTQTEEIDRLLYPFGYGDGGGGADRDQLEYLRREADLEGLPRTVWRSLPEHFEGTTEDAGKRIWHGELYLAWHRGTYTVQRKTKMAIFRLERALHDAEFLLAMSGEEIRRESRETLDRAWKTLLIHDFHDIAAGVGIRDVHAEAVEQMTKAEEAIRRLSDHLAMQVCGIPALSADNGSGAGHAWTVLNTLGFERKEYLELPDGRSGYVTLPAFGTAVLAAGPAEGRNGTRRDGRTAAPEPIRGTVRAEEAEDGYRIDNGVIAFILNKDGTLSGLVDLRTGLPLQDPGMRMNDFRMYRDVEPVYDAWELNRDYERDRTDEVRLLSLRVEGAGTPILRAVVERQIGNSRCRQEMTLRAGENRIFFETEVDWQERHRLLKVFFETNLRTDDAICGMQFCHLRRPAHRATAFARDRYEVCHHRYAALFETDHGMALLNRGIRGLSCREGELALTLLRAPCVPDDTCDRGTQHFSFAVGVYDRPFANAEVERDAYAYQAPVKVISGAGKRVAGMTAEHAIIETVKPAEAGPGTVIRLWEYRGARSRVTLTLPERAQIFSCGPDELHPERMAVSDQITLEMHAFEVRTLLLKAPDEERSRDLSSSFPR